MDGTSAPGSPAGSTTTNGMERLVSRARWDSSRPDRTRITPCGRRAATWSAQVRPGVRRPALSERTTLSPASRATFSTARMTSIAQALSSSWKTRSIRGSGSPRPAAAGSRGCATAPPRGPGRGGDVGAAAVSTFETVGADTGLTRDLGEGRGLRGPPLRASFSGLRGCHGGDRIPWAFVDAVFGELRTIWIVRGECQTSGSPAFTGRSDRRGVGPGAPEPRFAVDVGGPRATTTGARGRRARTYGGTMDRKLYHETRSTGRRWPPPPSAWWSRGRRARDSAASRLGHPKVPLGTARLPGAVRGRGAGS